MSTHRKANSSALEAESLKKIRSRSAINTWRQQMLPSEIQTLKNKQAKAQFF